MARVAATWRGDRGMSTRGRSCTRLAGGAWFNLFLPVSVTGAGGNLARKLALLPFLRFTSDMMTGRDSLRDPLSEGGEQSSLHCCQTLWCLIS